MQVNVIIDINYILASISNYPLNSNSHYNAYGGILSHASPPTAHTPYDQVSRYTMESNKKLKLKLKIIRIGGTFWNHTKLSFA